MGETLLTCSYVYFSSNLHFSFFQLSIPFESTDWIIRVVTYCWNYDRQEKERMSILSPFNSFCHIPTRQGHGIIKEYRRTGIWRTTVWRIFAYDGRYAWSQSDAYLVFVICIRRILHMTDQFSWSHWVRHIHVHLYNPCCTVNCNVSVYWS